MLAAVAPGYATVLIARVLAALAAAAFVPAASAAASSLAPAEYRGRALATVVARMTVAQVPGVPFGAFVGASLGWRYTFMFIAALDDGISQEVSRVTVGGIGLSFCGVILMRVIMQILRD